MTKGSSCHERNLKICSKFPSKMNHYIIKIMLTSMSSQFWSKITCLISWNQSRNWYNVNQNLCWKSRICSQPMYNILIYFSSSSRIWIPKWLQQLKDFFRNLSRSYKEGDRSCLNQSNRHARAIKSTVDHRGRWTGHVVFVNKLWMQDILKENHITIEILSY